MSKKLNFKFDEELNNDVLALRKFDTIQSIDRNFMDKNDISISRIVSDLFQVQSQKKQFDLQNHGEILYPNQGDIFNEIHLQKIATSQRFLSLMNQTIEPDNQDIDECTKSQSDNSGSISSKQSTQQMDVKNEENIEKKVKSKKRQRYEVFENCRYGLNPNYQSVQKKQEKKLEKVYNYTKNSFRNIMKWAFHVIETCSKNDNPDEYQELLELCEDDKDLVIAFKKYIKGEQESQPKSFGMGPKQQQTFLLAEVDEEKEQFKQIFSEFIIWWLKTKALRQILSKNIEEKKLYINYKNDTMLPLYQNPAQWPYKKTKYEC